MAWSRTSIAFLLVAFGHLAYVAGELDPIVPAAFFDTFTAGVMIAAAWNFAKRGDDIPWGLAIAFGAFAVIKVLDLFTSFFDGLFLYHVGFFPIVIGTIMVCVAAISAARGGSPERSVRIGAGLNAFGSLVYFGLGVQSIVADGSTNVGFLVGAFAATAGWAQLALRGWDEAVEPVIAPSTGTP